MFNALQARLTPSWSVERVHSAATRATGVACVALSCSSYDGTIEATGYTVEVVARDIRLPDGLARHPSGAILVTEEYRGGGVLRVDPVSGLYSYIARDLADPDNLIVVDGEIYFTAEDSDGRIARIDLAENLSTFADGLRSPEGLDIDPDGNLYVAEHSPGGNVYRYTPDGSRSTIGQVEDGEGLRVLPDGSVVVAETSVNRISRFFPDGRKTTVAEDTVTSPDGIAYDPVADNLLVTEDEAPGRLIRMDYETGELQVVATGLNKPQTMLLEEDGSILLSEQGEDRVLRLRVLAP